MEAPVWRLLRALQGAFPKCQIWLQSKIRFFHVPPCLPFQYMSIHHKDTSKSWSTPKTAQKQSAEGGYQQLVVSISNCSWSVVGRCWQGPNLSLEIATVIILPALFMLPSASWTRCLGNNNLLSFANRLEVLYLQRHIKPHVEMCQTGLIEENSQ